MEIKHKQFKPFDRVLVRDCRDIWQIDLYSYWNANYNIHCTLSYGGGLDIFDNDILPYEGNERLLGTTDEPEEEIELEEGEKIICSDFIERMNSGKGSLEDFERVVNNRFYSKTDFNGYSYAIRFSDFNPNDMEETKKHILCVKNGKIVKYRHEE